MAGVCGQLPRRLLHAVSTSVVRRAVPQLCQGVAVCAGGSQPWVLSHGARATAAHGRIGATRTFVLNSKLQGGGAEEVHEPLVFLHGLMGSLTSLGTLSRAKEVSRGRQVVTLDMRNHGHSAHSDDMSWTAMADDVVETVDAVCGQGREFSVLGHSLGGKVAMALAMAHPARIRSIVVADVAPVKYAWTNDDDALSVPNVVRAAHSLDLAQFATRQEAQAALFQLLPNQTIVQFVAQNLEVKDGRLAWRMNVDVFHRKMGEIGEFLPAPAQPLKTPATFVGGSRSQYLAPQHHATVRKYFGDAQIHMLEGAGHWLHAEQPKPFEKLVVAHLKRHSAGV